MCHFERVLRNERKILKCHEHDFSFTQNNENITAELRTAIIKSIRNVCNVKKKKKKKWCDETGDIYLDDFQKLIPRTYQTARK